MTKRICLGGIFVVVMLLLASCISHEPPVAAVSVPLNGNHVRLQLIVKFKPTRVPEVNAAVVERLSRENGVTFVFIRAMSGGACVLAVKEPLSSAARETLLRRLRARGDIEYVTVDRVMRPLAR